MKLKYCPSCEVVFFTKSTCCRKCSDHYHIQKLELVPLKESSYIPELIVEAQQKRDKNE